MAHSCSVYQAGSSWVLRCDTAGIETGKAPVNPQTSIIFDRSGSMGQYVERMINHILPKVMCEGLNMKLSDSVNLITFDSVTETTKMTIDEMTKNKLIKARGCTTMSPVFQELQKNLIKTNPYVRIIVVSDGQVGDSQYVLTEAEKCAKQLKQAGYQIIVYAVRLFTSQSQPDTKALASVLQLNTVNGPPLLDIHSYPEYNFGVICKQLTTMFKSVAGLDGGFVLKSETPVLQMFPWSTPTDEILLTKGVNTLWCSEPPMSVKINDQVLDIVMGEMMTQDSFGKILSDKLAFFIDKVKINTVIGTETAKQEIQQIIKYFQTLDTQLKVSDDLSEYLKDGSLRGRFEFLSKSAKRTLKTFINQLQTLANVDLLNSVNKAQAQADYLRQVDSTKTGKALAKRAFKAGIEDIDDDVRQEIQEMSTHIDELKDVDDSEHRRSFYSFSSTKDGLLELAKLVADGTHGELSAHEILLMFNLVGVACVATKGDYPDPSTYRLTQFFPNCYVSIADLCAVKMIGGQLKAPGTDMEIVNVVPVYDTSVIQRFCQKYLPLLLDVSTSIGMRGMMLRVPLTYPYTICAGVRRMIQSLDHDKSEANIMLFRDLLRGYITAIGGYFNFLEPLFGSNQDPDKAYFLGHNGTSNLIAPLYGLVKTGNLQYFDRVFRSLYSYEVYLAMRRFCEKQKPEERESYRTQLLDQLLGVDFAKYGTPLPKLMTRPEPTHYDAVHEDETLRGNLTKTFGFANYMCLIPAYFHAVIRGDNDNLVKMIRDVPELNDDYIKNTLKLTFPLERFFLFNIVEALLYTEKKDRVETAEDKTESAKLGDLGNVAYGEKMIRDYVVGRYKLDYERRLAVQEQEENKVLIEMLTERLIGVESKGEFNEMLRDGIKLEDRSYRFVNNVTDGFDGFMKRLIDPKVEVKGRLEKLWVVCTGCDMKEHIVFNNGNMLLAYKKMIEEFLMSRGNKSKEMWTMLDTRYTEKCIHKYRELPNRHSHSNSKQSFWALTGGKVEILCEYLATLTPEEVGKYCELHKDCCGVAQYLTNKMAIETVAMTL